MIGEFPKRINPYLVLFLSHRLLVLMLKCLVEILSSVQLLVVADQLVLQLGDLRVRILSSDSFHRDDQPWCGAR